MGHSWIRWTRCWKRLTSATMTSWSSLWERDWHRRCFRPSTRVKNRLDLRWRRRFSPGEVPFFFFFFKTSSNTFFFFMDYMLDYMCQISTGQWPAFRGRTTVLLRAQAQADSTYRSLSHAQAIFHNALPSNPPHPFFIQFVDNDQVIQQLKGDAVYIFFFVLRLLSVEEYLLLFLPLVALYYYFVLVFFQIAFS